MHKTLTTSRSRARVWVRTSQNTPTSLMVGSDDIVDDLKSKALAKYPHSLAAEFDTPDLSFSFRSQLLEADLPLMAFLDTHFPGGMPSAEALLIETRGGASKGTTVPPVPAVSREVPVVPEGVSEGGLNLSVPAVPHFHGRTKSVPVLNQEQSKPLDSYAMLLLPRNYDIPSQKLPPQITTPSLKDYPDSPGTIIPPQKSPITPTSATSVISDNSANSIKTLTSNINTTSENDTTLIQTQNIITNSSQSNKNTGPVVNLQKPPIKSLVSQIPIETKKQPALSLNPISSALPLNNLRRPTTTEQVLPNINILVVEDNIINQAILAAFLRKRKIHYQMAKSGEEAIEKWKQGGIHLVLMDIHLPKISGIDATKEIRKLEKFNRIGIYRNNTSFANLKYNNNNNSNGNSNGNGALATHQDTLQNIHLFRSPVIIVALTANTLASDRQEALAAGCNDFLTKPVNLDWLQNKITEWGCMQALIDFEGWKSGERLKK